MRRFSVLAAGAGAAALLCGGLVAGTGPALGATSAPAVYHTPGSWGAAREVPGLAALNTDGAARVNSVSCASAGNCAAGGYYKDSPGYEQAFVVNETGGKWGMAREVPGTAALNADGAARVNSVSCASAGNCAAGGTYKDSSGALQAFVVNETGGTWGMAREVPGTAALNTNGAAQVESVSCASAGNCAAAGEYTDSFNRYQVFVVNETGGKWGMAREVPGLAALSAGGSTVVESVSCGSAGNCAAGGYYRDSPGYEQAFVVDETGGKWGMAREVPGLAALNAGGIAQVSSVSCASAATCAAGGFYKDSSGDFQAFVADGFSGKWGMAQEVPGTAALNAGGDARVNSVSCGSAVTCTAGGTYIDSSGHLRAFAVSEAGDTWFTAQKVSGTALNAGGLAQVFTVSCGSVFNCAAGGFYTDSSGHWQAFVADETGGTWTAQEVHGSAALNAGGSAVVESVSCVAAVNCAAGGYYTDASGHAQAFVADEAWGTSTAIALSAPTVPYGHEQAGHVSVTVSSVAGTPGGTVTVKSGAAAVCTITLAGGKGSCPLGATRLPAGTRQLTASYAGTAGFAASTSPAATLTVAKAASATALSLSAATVTHGHEQAEKLTVTVTPQYSGTPGGKVTVKSGATAICTITLAGGKGSCTLTASQLGAGTYHLVAAYPGSSDFTGSASVPKTLVVK